MCADRFGSGDYLLVGGCFVPVTDVIHNGPGEDEAVLHHDAHLAPQGADGDFGYIRAVD